MTVGELIEVLNEFEEDLEVSDYEGDSIREVSLRFVQEKLGQFNDDDELVGEDASYWFVQLN
jgi:hypothetical protein